jgi:dethiobiotin synthetase
LLIEGSGGLLVPLGENYRVIDLIERLNCEVVIVSRNRLGTINHTLLTVGALFGAGIRRMKVVLMTDGRTDVSAATNKKVLRELMRPVQVNAIEFLGKNASKVGDLKKNYEKVKKTLARFCR